MKSILIAQIAQAINLAYCLSIGDTSQAPWEDLTEDSKLGYENGVAFVIANPDAGPEAQHEQWMKQKLEDGWIFGAVKDAEKKIHPALVAFSELPIEQRSKDYLFRATVLALKDIEPEVAEQPAPTTETAKPEVKLEDRVAGIPPGFTPIKYIGVRDEYKDPISGTFFTKGATELIHSDKAVQMLKHPDQYVLGDIESAPQAVQVASTPVSDEKTPANTGKNESEDTESEIQEAKDLVNSMGDVEAIRKYVGERFAGHKLHHNLGLEKAKTAAINLIDQFGLK